ncbi:phosphatase PAP2 family protein [Athalassotoga saccharophila]|uniref:phosphatase PAP2 family protein n=1 Tax=Athalassotoga saccharophila TaxID=1441386 RepID=UPI00137AE9D6|nr:phosphatase PAP2 family protein [Athalassotoga saccharophila]BBJ28721.1 putative undecaprenyl-diphosphatase YbjG [Athalassotoga saccharophila]
MPQDGHVKIFLIFAFILIFSVNIFGSQDLDLSILKMVNGTPQPIFDVPKAVISSDYFAGILGLSSIFISPYQTLVTFGITLGEVEILKNIFERPRPFQTYDWVVKRADASGYSMPSGHAAMAFESAYIWSEYFPRFSPLFYALATYVAISRVYYGVHYPSDVIIGGIIGYLTAFTVSKNFKSYPVIQLSYAF